MIQIFNMLTNKSDVLLGTNLHQIFIYLYILFFYGFLKMWLLLAVLIVLVLNVLPPDRATQQVLSDLAISVLRSCI